MPPRMDTTQMHRYRVLPLLWTTTRTMMMLMLSSQPQLRTMRILPLGNLSTLPTRVQESQSGRSRPKLLMPMSLNGRPGPVCNNNKHGHADALCHSNEARVRFAVNTTTFGHGPLADALLEDLLDVLPTRDELAFEMEEQFPDVVSPYYVETCLQEARDIQVNHKSFTYADTKDAENLAPNFGYISTERIKKTLAGTTQYYRAVDYGHKMRRHFKTRFPAANISRLNEDVATDTLFSETPAHDDGIPGHGGCEMMQIYTGTTSRLTEGFPMASETDIPDTLNDMIRKRGAMNRLISDNAKAATSKAIKEILNWYKIRDWQSEPEYQNQNPAERRIGDIKRMVDSIMARTGTPPKFWLLCTLYVITLMNHLVLDSLSDKCPLSIATGQPTDISAFMTFRWWEPVYYGTGEADTEPEGLGRWVGPAEHCGDALTYLILTNKTQQVISRSVVRTATDPKNPNLRVGIQGT